MLINPIPIGVISKFQATGNVKVMGQQFTQMAIMTSVPSIPSHHIFQKRIQLVFIVLKTYKFHKIGWMKKETFSFKSVVHEVVCMFMLMVKKLDTTKIQKIRLIFSSDTQILHWIVFGRPGHVETWWP